MLVPVIFTSRLNGNVFKGVLDEPRGRYMTGSEVECARALSGLYPSWCQLRNFSDHHWTITRLTRID